MRGQGLACGWWSRGGGGGETGWWLVKVVDEVRRSGENKEGWRDVMVVEGGGQW